MPARPLQASAPPLENCSAPEQAPAVTAPRSAAHAPGALPTAEWSSYSAIALPGENGFAAFCASPAYDATHQQWLKRIDQCLRLANRWLTGEERGRVSTRLHGLASLLGRDRAGSCLGERSPLLFGPAKRHMDSFCLQLMDPAVDVFQARVALLDLAQGLQSSLGPIAAFIDAASAMDPPLSSPQRECHAALIQLLRQQLHAFFEAHAHHLNPRRTPDRQADLVNWLLLELGLPGGAVEREADLAAAAIDQSTAMDGVNWLRLHVTPAHLATLMAVRYRAELQRLLPDTLQMRATEDLSVHQDVVANALHLVSQRYPGIPLCSTVNVDPVAGITGWCREPGLLMRHMWAWLEQEG